ncbi:MAG: ATP-binding protein [Deferrisomatales bacterium]
MAKRKDPPTLRRRAEDTLKSQVGEVWGLGPEESRRLVHELQVHQIELELQNEELRTSQVELAAARDRYADLFDFAPIGYFTLDPAGIIREVNLAGAELLGVERRRLVGRPFSAHVDRNPAEQVALRRLREAVRAEGGRQEGELRLTRAGAESFPARVMAAATQDAAGGSITWRVVVSDITAEKRAEAILAAREAHYRHLFEDAHAVVLLIEPRTGRIVDANPAAGAYYGRSREELQALRVADLDTRGARTPWPENANGRHRKRRQTLARHRLAGGEVRDVEVFSGPLEVGGRTLHYCLVFDVTERVRAEAALREAKAEAEAANRAKSAFLARTSHELRTPLNGILGMAELALREAVSPPARGYLGLVGRSARDLLGIINDLLDLARIDAGRVELHPEVFDPAHEVRQVASTLMALAAEKGLELAVSLSPRLPAAVRADRGRLTQVLVNLVGNAVKFTDRGTVTLAVAPADGADPRPGEPARLAFAVRDTGIGIAAERLPTLFEPFADSGASHHARYGGTGLGLAICRELVRRMGGEIEVESEPGAGSTFRFTVEAEAAARCDAQETARPHPPALGVPLRVLVAEDDPTNQFLWRELLEQEGHQAVLVPNGREALDALAREPFDLVLMDVLMPEMDGLEATRLIREGALPGVPRDLPIVAITAHAQRGDRDRMLAAGMDDYVAKPVDFDLFYRALSRAAHRRQAGGDRG